MTLKAKPWSWRKRSLKISRIHVVCCLKLKIYQFNWVNTFIKADLFRMLLSNMKTEVPRAFNFSDFFCWAKYNLTTETMSRFLYWKISWYLTWREKPWRFRKPRYLKISAIPFRRYSSLSKHTNLSKHKLFRGHSWKLFNFN